MDYSKEVEELLLWYALIDWWNVAVNSKLDG
jgi:hypothetical protein